MKIKGVIFDMDGVVTQTATLHFKAWKNIIEQFLNCINKKHIFTETDYFLYLDGMPRKDGITNYFNNIGLSNNEYNLEECIEDLCNKKNELILQILLKEKIECFKDTLIFIEFLLINDYKIALISSSKNCLPILKKAQIDNVFSIYVDGVISEQLNLPGKPHPGIFLEAAKRLNLLPEECLIIEDALAGVKAAKNGGFGGVVALDRKNKLYQDFLNLQPDYILTDLSPNQIFLYQQLKLNKKNLEFGFNALSYIFDITEKNQLIIFLDYDGTLTPIVETPEKAILSQKMHQCLSNLSKNFLTVIISGRELTNLKKLINISNIFYSGNHGLEFFGPVKEMSYQIGNEFKEEISSVYLHLHALFKNISGCIIENKIFSLSIHYRLVKDSLHKYILQLIDEILIDYPNLVRCQGKKVFEIRPNIHWNKGIASEFILNNFKIKNSNLIPIYIGDDVSDEDAFEQLNDKGITIKVMNYPQNTKAHYFLKSPMEVQNFLSSLNSFKESL